MIMKEKAIKNYVIMKGTAGLLTRPLLSFYPLKDTICPFVLFKDTNFLHLSFFYS